MKTKLHSASRLLPFVYVIFTSMVFCAATVAQNTIDVKNTQIALPPPPPNEEEFEKSDGIVLPSRSTVCPLLSPAIRERECREQTEQEWLNTAVVTLYNESGAVWYRYTHKVKVSTSKDNDPEEHFIYNSMRFMPLAMILYNTSILRLVAESEHWYEVEVNIETKATKFVLKKDPRWAKKDWSYFLGGMKYFDLLEEQSLLDKPNGKIIEETADLKFTAVRFLKVDKDWIYVDAELKDDKKLYRGWVQWRKEEKVLIGANASLVYFFKPKDKEIVFKK